MHYIVCVNKAQTYLKNKYSSLKTNVIAVIELEDTEIYFFFTVKCLLDVRTKTAQKKRAIYLDYIIKVLTFNEIKQYVPYYH